jgi:hypothetical protein
LSISIEESADRSGILYTAAGSITAHQLFSALDQIQSLGKSGHRWTFCQHDFIAAGTLECSSHQIRNLAQTAKGSLTSIFPKGTAVAFVAPSDLYFGLARMWLVYAEETGWEIAVFRSRTESEHWIEGRVRARFGIEAHATATRNRPLAEGSPQLP